VKAMLAIAQSIDVGPEEVALLGTVGVETIPIPNSYTEAINHPQYGITVASGNTTRNRIT
jgi:hypothetical protein